MSLTVMLNFDTLLIILFLLINSNSVLFVNFNNTAESLVSSNDVVSVLRDSPIKLKIKKNRSNKLLLKIYRLDIVDLKLWRLKSYKHHVVTFFPQKSGRVWSTKFSYFGQTDFCYDLGYCVGKVLIRKEVGTLITCSVAIYG